jgi:predicted kinase
MENRMNGTLHFIAGSTGAGKTTYAKALAAEIGGVCFAVDDWMAKLFWPDSAVMTGGAIDPAWAMARIERCAAMIWHVAVDVARAGTPVLLELGFTTAETRSRYAILAAEAGLSVKLHFVDVAAAERWRRVEARNAAASGLLDFPIDRAMFDYVEGMWQPPSDAEMAAMDGVRVG